MPEAEVALLLAFYLLRRPESTGEARVNIDGACVEIRGRSIFDVRTFLRDRGWNLVPRRQGDWRGVWALGMQHLDLHENSREGDVVATIGGRRIRAECKGGPLVDRKSNPENRILRDAIGQCLFLEDPCKTDLLLVAVPCTNRFRDRAGTWRNRPLFKNTHIGIVLISQNGTVEGFDELEKSTS